MISCPNCGRSNPDGNRFCNECGARLGRPVPCPNCGYENLSTSRFCGYCGTRLSSPPAASTETPPLSALTPSSDTAQPQAVSPVEASGEAPWQGEEASSALISDGPMVSAELATPETTEEPAKVEPEAHFEPAVAESADLLFPHAGASEPTAESIDTAIEPSEAEVNAPNVETEPSSDGVDLAWFESGPVASAEAPSTVPDLGAGSATEGEEASALPDLDWLEEVTSRVAGEASEPATTEPVAVELPPAAMGSLTMEIGKDEGGDSLDEANAAATLEPPSIAALPSTADLQSARLLGSQTLVPSVAMSDEGWGLALAASFRTRRSRGRREPSPSVPPSAGSLFEKLLRSPSAPRGQSGSQRSIWRRLVAPFLNLGLLAALLIPFFIPLAGGNEVAASTSALSFYRTIEALPAGSAVVVSYDWDAATLGEMEPLSRAITTHLLRKQARLIYVSLVPQGPAFAQRILSEVEGGESYRYGENYVNLGYLSGNESALVSLASGFARAFPRDYLDRPTSDLPLLKRAPSLREVALVVEISADDGHMVQWIQQVQSRYGTRMLGVTSMTAAPSLSPYYTGDHPQLSGFLAGTLGASEYASLLSQKPRYLQIGAQALSIGIAFLIAVIVLGNVVWIVERMTRRNRGEGNA